MDVSDHVFIRFFDLVPDLCSIATTSGYFIRVNDAFATVLGYSQDEMTSRPFVDFIHDNDVTMTLHELAKLSHGASVSGFVNRYRTKSGKYRSLMWSAYPYEDLIFATARDVTAQIEAEQSLRAWAMCDYLTGLPGRRQFDIRIHEAVGRTEPFSLMFIDIDDFKKINDAKGHSAGDDALVSVAKSLRLACRKNDHAFRIGGDEFALLVSGVDGLDSVTKRIIEGLSVDVSIGRSAFPIDGCSVPELMRAADLRMYENKKNGAI